MGKPKRRFRGIEVVRSGGAWKWRARVMVRGELRVGTLRESQELAHADLGPLRHFQSISLKDALENVVRDAQARGLREDVVRGVYRNPANAVLALFNPTDQLQMFTSDDILWMIREFLEMGRAPITIKKGYLRVLHQAFELAGVESPIPEARKRARTMLRHAPAPMSWFLPEEVGAIVRKMREHREPRAQRDADLVTLIALTGIRSGELSRVLVSDVDVDRSTLTIREAKVRSRPRVQPLAPPALEAVQRLLEGKRKADTLVGGSRVLNRMFERWKKRLGDPRLNGRALRRSHATGLILSGATMPEVRDQMGHHHSSTETMRYLEAVQAHRREHVNRLASEAFGLPDPSGPE